MSLEPDQRDIIGYSIDDPTHKKDWIHLVTEIEAYLHENDAIADVLFHGTSDTRATTILKVGMEPTDIDHATDEMYSEGSFWGQVRTAAAYAEDTTKHRDQLSRPVLLAIKTDELLADYYLYPDLATADFPLKGLTQLDDPEVRERWGSDFVDRTWHDSLFELGAITVVHDAPIEPNKIRKIESLEDLKALLERQPAVSL